MTIVVRLRRCLNRDETRNLFILMKRADCQRSRLRLRRGQTFRRGLCPRNPRQRGLTSGLSVSPSGTSCHLPCRGDTSGLSAPATAGCSAGCRQKRARCAHSSDNPVTRWTQSASILCADSAAFARATAAVKTDMDCFFDSLRSDIWVMSDR